MYMFVCIRANTCLYTCVHTDWRTCMQSLLHGECCHERFNICAQSCQVKWLPGWCCCCVRLRHYTSTVYMAVSCRMPMLWRIAIAAT